MSDGTASFRNMCLCGTIRLVAKECVEMLFDECYKGDKRVEKFSCWSYSYVGWSSMVMERFFHFRVGDQLRNVARHVSLPLRHIPSNHIPYSLLVTRWQLGESSPTFRRSVDGA